MTPEQFNAIDLSPSAIDPNDIVVFLEAMFGSKTAKTGKILIWREEGKKSQWFETALEAAQSIKSSDVNVYLSAGLSPRDFGPGRRCRENQVMATMGACADFDIAGPGHKQSNNFESAEEVFTLLGRFGLKPSILVWSGGGIHAWWLFAKPWKLDNAEDRNAAKELYLSLLNALRSLTHRNIDAVHNLDRLMRVPGTINRKNGCSVDNICKIIELGGVRYTPMALDKACRKILSINTAKQAQPVKTAKAAARNEQGAAPGETKEGGARRGDQSSTPSQPPESSGPSETSGPTNIILDVSRKPPEWLFQTLLESDAKFANTWHKQRDKSEENPDGFPSNSEYDFSLASFANNAGWNDQEIADLIITWRTKHNVFDKSLFERNGIYQSKIHRIIDIVKKNSDLCDANKVIADVELTGNAPVISDEDKKLALDTFIKKTGLPLVRIKKISGDKPEYLWDFGILGEKLLNLNDTFHFRNWKSRIWGEIGGHAAKNMKQSEWEALLVILDKIMIKERDLCDDTDDDADGNGEAEYRDKEWVAEMVRNYIQDSRACERTEAIYKNQPFYDHRKTRWRIMTQPFLRYIRRTTTMREPKSFYLSQFAVLGFGRQSRVAAQAPGKKLIRPWYWAVPLNVCKENETFNMDSIESEELNSTVGADEAKKSDEKGNVVPLKKKG